MLTRLALAILLVASGSVVLAPEAAADPTPPECRIELFFGGCDLTVIDDGRPSSTDPGTGDQVRKVGKKGCFAKGKEIPCTTADGFWDPASGCYLQPRDQPSTFGDTSKLKPGTKFYRCWVLLDVVDGKPVGEARFESVIREPGEPQTIDPRVAAQQVVETMDFVAPHLGLSPYVQSAQRQGIVNTPIWMWVTDPGEHTTGPLTESATLGGVSVEAVGTVDRIEWATGDGQTVTCKGPGTPFTRATAAGRSLKDLPESPTCGHKYAKTSRCLPGGKYQVTATAYWNVHWTAGGLEGDIPFQFSRATSLSVVDLRPVLVAPDGAGDPQVTSPPRSCS